MCHHANILDDFESADVVCMDCGLVLDRIIGADSRLGQRFVGHSSLRPACQAPEKTTPYEGSKVQIDKNETDIEGREELLRERIRREEVSPLLSVFHLDGGAIEEDALSLFCRIFALRSKVRKSEWKKNLALAFSIARTLSKHRCPRPIDDILLICGVPLSDRGQLLQMSKWMNLSKSEMENMDPNDYEWEDASPQHYIDTLCSFLNIPFHVASEMEIVAQNSEYVLYGKHPSLLAAAAMQIVLKKLGYLHREPQLADEICRGLGCQQKAITDLLRHDFYRKWI